MLYAPYQSATATTRLPRLRAVVRPDLATLPDAELAGAIASELGSDAAELESFLSGLQQFGQAVLQRAPSILSGLAQGGLVGGLPGAIIGGVAGGLTAPAPAGPQRAPGPRPSAGGPPPAAMGPAAGGGAAASLLGLLANPSVQQAMTQMVMGRTGGQQVTLPGGEHVPNQAFAELIREVADQALAESAAQNGEATAEDLPEYLTEHRRRGASEDPVLRAAVLLRLLEPPTTVVPVATPAQPAIPAPAAPGAWPQQPAGAAQPAPPGPPAATGPPGAGPLGAYTPPDLGAQGPTVYSLDQSYREQVNQAWADWEFDQALEDVLGGPGSTGGMGS
jgi:hypothetical protein